MIAPSSWVNSPKSWVISVVLPAPLGPISAWISPSRTSRSTPSVATSPPKRLRRLRTDRSGSVMARSEAEAPEQSVEPALREEHDQQQDRPEHDLPMLGPARQHGFEDDEDSRTQQRAEQRADAAENDHDHQLAGFGPVQHVGADEAQIVRHQRT